MFIHYLHPHFFANYKSLLGAISHTRDFSIKNRSQTKTGQTNLDILEVEMSYSEWVERCCKERMKQILTDPAEFGKLVLPSVMRGHLVDNILDDL